MRKNHNRKMFLATLMALAVLLCSFHLGYAEDAYEEIPTEEAIVQASEASGEVVEQEPEVIEAHVEEPAAEPEVIEVPVEEPAAEPEVIEASAEEPATEPEVIEASVEEPETEPEVTEVPEEKQETAPEATEEPAEEPETEAAEEELIEFEDEDAGFVSEELLEDFNNPEIYDPTAFGGTVEIEMKNSEIYYGRDVTLVAKASGVEMNNRLVWEANDGDGRGWYTVGSGPEYTFTVSRDIVNREYRVVLFAVD